MPKLRLITLAIIFACTGFELNQSATATLSAPQLSMIASHSSPQVTSIALAGKKCTIRRYRRPH